MYLRSKIVSTMFVFDRDFISEDNAVFFLSGFLN